MVFNGLIVLLIAIFLLFVIFVIGNVIVDTHEGILDNRLKYTDELVGRGVDVWDIKH